MNDNGIALGDKVTDVITGFEGTAVGRFEYLNGCVRWNVQGVDKDDKPLDYTFDAEQLSRTGENTQAKAIIASRTATGGPRTTPSRR